MPKISSSKTAYRRTVIRKILENNPDGIRQADVSRLSGLDNRTVNNYLRSLRDAGMARKQGVLWFSSSPPLSALRPQDDESFDAFELYALYLAALSQSIVSDETLRKLATLLRKRGVYPISSGNRDDDAAGTIGRQLIAAKIGGNIVSVTVEKKNLGYCIELNMAVTGFVVNDAGQLVVVGVTTRGRQVEYPIAEVRKVKYA